MGANSFLWRLDGPGVFRVHNLDSKGRHNIIAIGPDHRALARVPVLSIDEARELGEVLRTWLKDPTTRLPPSVVLGLDPCSRRWLSHDT